MVPRQEVRQQPERGRKVFRVSQRRNKGRKGTINYIAGAGGEKWDDDL